MPAKGKRKNNPGKSGRLCPPLKTRLPVTSHPEPPPLPAILPPLPPQVTDDDDEDCDDANVISEVHDIDELSNAWRTLAVAISRRAEQDIKVINRMYRVYNR